MVRQDFGACFHYQEEKTIEKGIILLMQWTTLVHTIGQQYRVIKSN